MIVKFHRAADQAPTLHGHEKTSLFMLSQILRCDPLFCSLSVESAALRNGHWREKDNYRMTTR
jgi:hypothetical protein